MENARGAVFRGMTQKEYEALLSGGCIRTAAYEKGAVIFRAGSVTHEFGIVQTGSVHISSTDLWGNRTLLHLLTAGETFAETYAACRVPLMVEVSAAEASLIQLVDLERLLVEETSNRLLHNLFQLSAEKNLAWSARMLCLSAKTARARIMSYLSAEAVRRGSTVLTLPFDRQQLADYLNLERSALSKELGRMQREGLLRFRKNHFHLLQPEFLPGSE